MNEGIEAFKEIENYTCKAIKPQNDRTKLIFRLFLCVLILYLDKT